MLPLIAFTIAAAMTEVLSFAATKSGLLLFSEPPGNFYGFHWRTEGDAWGVWHKPHARDRHVTRCFDVQYQSNSIGARDDEFSKEAQPGVTRVILLGDSFAEGYGVDFASTSQALIEQYAGVEVLNFGSAGDFGPVQYYLLYDRVARQFEHDTVIVYLLPANDFRDNDYAARHDIPALVPTYRPYWKSTGTGHFEIVYPTDTRPSATYGGYPPGVTGTIRRFINEYTWSKNALRTARYILSAPSNAGFYSGYLDVQGGQAGW